MNLQFSKSSVRILLALMVIGISCLAVAQLQKQLLPASSPSVPTAKQKAFTTPQLAADALLKAAENYDVNELLNILGPEAKEIVASADPVHDRDLAQQFVRKAHEKNVVKVEKTRATVLVGNDEFPLPIPIVLKGGQWRFDTPAGRKEILFRRIGSNELDAIRICRGFVDAQNEYASTLHGDSHIHQYAKKVISTPGKEDGLFWNNPDGSAGGPISLPIAKALQEGYSLKPGSAYHGYYFKVLKGQGPNAPLGKMDYEIHGMMIGGYALVAVPAEYRVTGVKTFMVNHYGVVYEKDLGQDSVKVVQQMERFNPDKTWRETYDEQ